MQKNNLKRIARFLWLIILTVYMFFNVFILAVVVLMLWEIIYKTINLGYVYASGISDGWSLIMTCSTLIVPTFMIGLLRKMYDIYPWSLPLTVMLFANVVIFGLGVEIIHVGFQIQSTGRHILFISLMIIEVILLRLIMSFYFYRRPLG